MIRTAFASFVLIAAMAMPAAARERTFVAQLTTPVAERFQVVAEGAIWTCQGETCRAEVSQPATPFGCRTLVREVGAVLSYGSETRPMSEARLAACNAAAQPAETQSARNN
jgi:hypothetical protein